MSSSKGNAGWTRGEVHSPSAVLTNADDEIRWRQSMGALVVAAVEAMSARDTRTVNKAQLMDRLRLWQRTMKAITLHIGLDVHQDSVPVAAASENPIDAEKAGGPVV